MRLNPNTIVIMLLLGNTMPVLAGDMGAYDDALVAYDGFYAGATIGLSNLLDKEHHQVNPESHQLGSLGPTGGGFLGYEYPMTDWFNLGIEGYGNANGLNAAINYTESNTAVSYKVGSRYDAGARFVLGYPLSATVQPHVMLGYACAQFFVRDNGDYGIINTSFLANGFQSGFGWSGTFWQGFSLRLDMLYTLYATNTSNGVGLPGSGSPTQTYTNGFSTLEGDLSLVYKF